VEKSINFVSPLQKKKARVNSFIWVKLDRSILIGDGCYSFPRHNIWMTPYLISMAVIH